MTDLLTDRAVQYIQRRHAAPFYLALHYTAPHWPWEGPGDTAASRRYRSVADTVKNRFVKGYADGGSLQVFAAMVRRLDESVGRVLGALEAAGQSRDTFVVFTSDNGGERFSYNWPASDAKVSLHEGGIRVPAMVRWPGRVPAGSSTDQTVITMDWSATMLALGGTSADPQYPLDGVDLLPLCQGRPVRWIVRSSGAPGSRTQPGREPGSISGSKTTTRCSTSPTTRVSEPTWPPTNRTNWLNYGSSSAAGMPGCCPAPSPPQVTNRCR